MARNGEDKRKFLAALETTPFIGHAAKRAGISRATIYRWLKDNYTFRKQVEAAQARGRENIVEMAESVLVTKIRDGDMRGVEFFLKHNSPRYSSKTAPLETGAPGQRSFESIFRGPDGKVHISKKTAEYLEQLDQEERARKANALGLHVPDQDV